MAADFITLQISEVLATLAGSNISNSIWLSIASKSAVEAQHGHENHRNARQLDDARLDLNERLARHEPVWVR